jgi:hypothetical protein
VRAQGRVRCLLSLLGATTDANAQHATRLLAARDAIRVVERFAARAVWSAEEHGEDVSEDLRTVLRMAVGLRRKLDTLPLQVRLKE